MNDMNKEFHELSMPKSNNHHGWYVSTKIPSSTHGDYLHDDLTLHTTTFNMVSSGYYSTYELAMNARSEYYKKWGKTAEPTPEEKFDKAMKGI